MSKWKLKIILTTIRTKLKMIQKRVWENNIKIGYYFETLKIHFKLKLLPESYCIRKMHGFVMPTLDAKKQKKKKQARIHLMIEANLTDSTYPTGTVIMHCLKSKALCLIISLNINYMFLNCVY